MDADSPQWRKGPKCKPILCNACGTRFLRTRSLGKTNVRPAPEPQSQPAARGCTKCLLLHSTLPASQRSIRSSMNNPLQQHACMQSHCAEASYYLGLTATAVMGIWAHVNEHCAEQQGQADRHHGV